MSDAGESAHKPSQYQQGRLIYNPRASSTMGVWRSCDCMDELHVADIIEVYKVLQHHDEPLSIQAYSEDGRRKGKLADRGIALWMNVSLDVPCSCQ